jgi:hypothetical protein
MSVRTWVDAALFTTMSQRPSSSTAQVTASPLPRDRRRIPAPSRRAPRAAIAASAPRAPRPCGPRRRRSPPPRPPRRWRADAAGRPVMTATFPSRRRALAGSITGKSPCRPRSRRGDCVRRSRQDQVLVALDLDLEARLSEKSTAVTGRPCAPWGRTRDLRPTRAPGEVGGGGMRIPAHGLPFARLLRRHDQQPVGDHPDCCASHPNGPSGTTCETWPMSMGRLRAPLPSGPLRCRLRYRLRPAWIASGFVSRRRSA